MDEKLLQCTLENTKKFLPKVNRGKVIYIVDGDTLDIACEVDSEIVKIRVRLADIDTPELRSKKKGEKDHALAAKRIVEQLVYNKIVTLQPLKWGAFGRLVCKVFIDDFDVCKYLIDNKFAKKYCKQGKKDFNWDVYRCDTVNIEFSD
jgi:endonuclease YncB( thermonuclease family)